MDTYLQRSTVGVRWGEGGLINYRGTMAGICVEEERGLPHVLREIDLPHVLRRSIGIHAYVQERNKVGKKTKVERRTVGGGVASHKWWERPARLTEGMGAISIREGMPACLCTCV